MLFRWLLQDRDTSLILAMTGRYQEDKWLKVAVSIETFIEIQTQALTSYCAQSLHFLTMFTIGLPQS